MLLFDRFTGQSVDTEIDSLPRYIDLGRYYFIDGDNQGKDVTHRLISLGKDKLYFESLLEEPFVTDVLRQINFDTQKPGFVAVPFLQGIEDCIDLTNFEKLLLKKLSDVKHMCINPTSSLDREIQKENIGKAKRISNRGYEYLSCHTEDWNYKSIVSFKPNRVLSEVLEENTDVYENRLLVAFVNRAIEYLKSRITVTEYIKDFLTEYQRCLTESSETTMYWEKRNRNIELFTAVYDPKEGTSSLDTSRMKVSNTQNTLKQACNKLEKFSACPIFDEIKFNKNSKIGFHDTNVLLNDKFYKSLRLLWKEFDNTHKEKSEEDKILYEQDVIDSVRAYALTLIMFTCKRYLGYKNLMGRTDEWVASHPYLPQLFIRLDDNGYIHMNIGFHHEVKLIVSCTEPHFDTSTLGPEEYILAYGSGYSSGKIIGINVREVDSTERIGALLRKYILKDFIMTVNQSYDLDITNIPNYKNLLRQSFMSDIVGNKYTYTEYPEQINKDSFLSKFENSPITFEVKSQKKLDRKNTKSSANKVYINTVYELTKERVLSAVNSINEHSDRLVNLLKCPRCGEPYSKNGVSRLLSFKCMNPACGFVIDYENDYSLLHHPHLVRSDNDHLEVYYGMDYVDFNS